MTTNKFAWSCAVLFQLLAACASQPVTAPVPSALVPAGERPVERLVARGVQTYECRAKPGDPSSAAWIYVAADLELFDAQGKSAGKHTFPPPVWVALDGSAFVGSVSARADAPQAGAAQWLLLSARSTGGEGRFSKITSLQRVSTVGGVAPIRACDLKSIHAKETVPFTAEYVLFAK